MGLKRHYLEGKRSKNLFLTTNFNINYQLSAIKYQHSFKMPGFET